MLGLGCREVGGLGGGRRGRVWIGGGGEVEMEGF